MEETIKKLTPKAAPSDELLPRHRRSEPQSSIRRQTVQRTTGSPGRLGLREKLGDAKAAFKNPRNLIKCLVSLGFRHQRKRAVGRINRLK